MRLSKSANVTGSWKEPALGTAVICAFEEGEEEEEAAEDEAEEEAEEWVRMS